MRWPSIARSRRGCRLISISPGRRWNLLFDNGVIVKLPETGWRKQLAVLEHLIVDKGILERDVAEIDLRSPTHVLLRQPGPASRRRRKPNAGARSDGRDGAFAGPAAGYRPIARGLVAALDIGSSKVVCLIARAEPGALHVLGAALAREPGPARRHGDRHGAGRGIDPRLRGGGGEHTPTRASRTC